MGEEMMITTGNREKTSIWIGLSALLILSMVLIIPASASETYVYSVPYSDNIVSGDYEYLDGEVVSVGGASSYSYNPINKFWFADSQGLDSLVYMSFIDDEAPSLTDPTSLSEQTTVILKDSLGNTVGSGTLAYFWSKDALGNTLYVLYDLSDLTIDNSGIAAGAGYITLDYNYSTDLNGLMPEFTNAGNTYDVDYEAWSGFVEFGYSGGGSSRLGKVGEKVYAVYDYNFVHDISITASDVTVTRNSYASTIYIYTDFWGGIVDSTTSNEIVTSNYYNTPLYIDIKSPVGDWYNYTYSPSGGESGQPYIRFRALDQSTYGLLDGATMGILKNSTGTYNEYTMAGGIQYLYVDPGEWYKINCTMAGYVTDEYNIMFTAASTDAVFYMAPTGSAPGGSWQVNFYVYDDDSEAWLNQAVVTLYEGGTLLDTEITNAAGYATANIVNGTTLTYKATKAGYLSGTGTIVVTSDREVYIPCILESSLPTATATGTTTIGDAGELSEASRTSARTALASAAEIAPALFVMLLLLIFMSALKKA